MTMKISRATGLGLFAALLLFWNLGYAPFLNPDEGRYASASYEMAFGLNGSPIDWLVPHLDGAARLNKPPLVYWTTASFFKILGPSSWAGRIPAALASLVVLLVIWVWAARVWNQRAAALSSLVWATTVYSAAMGRVANTDMLLCASIALASFGAFWLLEAGSKRGKSVATLALGVGMGFALLSKGPVGVALPLVGMAIYVLLSRTKFERRAVSGFTLALCVALAIGLPWFILVASKRPHFLSDFIFAENLRRFGGGENFHNKPSPIYYLPVVLVGLLPWTAFLVLAVSARSLDDRARRARLFLWIWSLGIIAFFSASNTKLVSYILPAFPALALLVGSALAAWPKTSPRLRVAAVFLALFLNLAIFTAISAFPKRDKATKTWGMAPGVLLDERIFPREEGVRWVWILGATLSLQSAGWLLCLRRPDARTLGVVGATNSALLLLVMLQLTGVIVRYEDGSALVVALAPELKPNEKLVNFRCFIPSSVVQSGRAVVFANFRNTSGLDPLELQNNPNFPVLTSGGQLLQWLELPAQKTGALILVKGPLESQFAAALHLWGRNNDFFLYATRVKPANFDFDFVAPRKRDRLPAPDFQPGEDLPGARQ